MKLPTAESFYDSLPNVPVAGRAAKLVNGDIKLPRAKAKTPPIRVRVNCGRWIVQCPWCNSAQHASETDRRFMCAPDPHGCSNEFAEGKWIAVEWPKDADAIEEALSRRPVPNRNWEPDETVDDLLRENAEMFGEE